MKPMSTWLRNDITPDASCLSDRLKDLLPSNCIGQIISQEVVKVELA